MSSVKEPSRKKTKHNDEETQYNTISNLNQDELFHILNYIPLDNKLDFTCTSKSVFQLIEKATRDKLYAYDKSVPLYHMWYKYNEYTVKAGDIKTLKKELDELKKLLDKTGSFTYVTKKLCLNLILLSEEKEMIELVEEFLSVPTGRDTTVQIIESSNAPVKTITVPEIMGYTLKHCDLAVCETYLIKPQLFCKLESLSIDSELAEYEDVPEIKNLYLLSELKQLTIDSGVSEQVSEYLSKLCPNLQILRIPQYYEGISSYINNCPKIRDIYIDTGDTAANISDEDVLEMVEQLPELKRLEILSNSFTGSAFNTIGKNAKKLEYLNVNRWTNEPIEVYEDTEFGGGELPCLKTFIFDGDLSCSGVAFDLPKIFKSVVKYCPKISKVSITDEVENFIYPCNLYGLVPVENVTELTLYKLDKKNFGKFEIPGDNALDVITNKNRCMVMIFAFLIFR
jgi:hypothetical protein